MEAIWDYVSILCAHLRHQSHVDDSQWQYFVPIQERLPQNCSTDLVKTIDYIDSILTGPDENAKDALKKKFLLGDLRDDDFAEYLRIIR